MGQYYKVINIDKREVLNPHRCGDGLKLLEFGLSTPGTMACLAILLADGNGRGGGDLRSDNPIIGTWAGDRIVIAGDYADANFLDDFEGEVDEDGKPVSSLYTLSDSFRDVSHDAMRALCDDGWVRELLKARDPWARRQLAPVLAAVERGHKA